MEEMSEYLLNPCQLILEPEYIYLDAERKSVRFCYLPGFHGEIQKQFQSLAEYILPKLDHEDGKAVMLGYNVYRRALEDSFHLEYIKEELYKICNSDEEDFSVFHFRTHWLFPSLPPATDPLLFPPLSSCFLPGPLFSFFHMEKNLQRTHRSGKQTKYGSQWLDLVQHWCFFWELRQEWPADIFQE